MMRNPTAAEKTQAILGAVPAIADYLDSIGKLEAFNAFTKDDVCGLIRAAQEAVQDGLRAQLHDAMRTGDDDEIPF